MRLDLIFYNSLFLLALHAGVLPAQEPADSLAAARRVASIVSLAAKEYALGVAPGGGQVVLREEVDEAKLFLDQGRFDVAALPAAVRAHADSQLVALRRLFDELAPPSEVERRSAALITRLAGSVAGPLEPAPPGRPSLLRGADVYREQCAQCHGETGLGDGPKAATVEGPPPANLADPAVMAGVPLADIYRKIVLGVPGTAMPEFESTLSEEDRWAVAAYVATLHGAAPRAAAFAAVRRELARAVSERSERLVFDAYLTFEQVEVEVRARRPDLAREVETAFAELRAAAHSAPPDELAGRHGRLLAALERAERALADRPSGTALFFQSLVIMLREGFEAILIIAALLAFVSKAGAVERRREIAWGAWLAVGASVLTAVLFQLVLRVTPAHREMLEGFTLLLATAVLFYVSYWLLSRVEAAKWTAFVKERMSDALTAGSWMALAGVAFLAVYREGFETILFYQALLASAGNGGTGAPAVVGGILAGGVLLVGVYVAINYFGLKLPLRPFFTATGAMLYVMAFIFAGKGIAELQEAGLVDTTVVSWMPRAGWLGVYPTIESLAVQGLLVVLMIVGLAWLRFRPSSSAPAA